MPEPDFLSEPELKAFFQSVVDTSRECVVDRNLLVVSLLAGLCLRVSEVCSLRLDNLDLTSTPGALRVHRKGGKEARLPLNEKIRDLLDTWLEQREQWASTDSPWVFVSTRGSRLSVRQVQNVVRRALEHAGFVKRHMGPHLLRHSGASFYLASGTDIKTIQALLGHSNLSTTSRYVHTTAAAIRTAVDGFAIRRK
ncbi:tyrosine-type recombinase/integrase [Desulfacinum hydrothermale]